MTTIAEIQRDIAAGRDPGEFIAEARSSIAARDPELKAFVALHEWPAAGQGPLAGVAVGVKDIVDTAEMPTACGSSIYAGWRPKADAAIVTMLKRAGATVIGKTSTTAFAFLDPTPTLNPHDPAATPGGSSSGSAAAVAAGLVPLAIGTQTGGSVIRPAAFCGVAAIKPSYGLLPTVGVKCFSWSLDTLGLFAQTVGDLTLALAALTQRQEFAPGRRTGPKTIGITRQPFAGPATPEADAALERAAQAAHNAGHSVTEVTLPDSFADAFAAHPALQNHEATLALGFEWREHRAALPPKLAALLAEAETLTPEAYDEARRVAKQARDAARRFFRDCDALLTYPAVAEAPSRETTGDPRFNRLWTLLGTPCIHVPIMKGPHGLPVGVQLIAGFGRDAEALEMAASIETALKG